MTERLGVSSLWADTLATFRAHRTVLLTLAAAFIFLPQIVASLALQAAGVTLDLGAMLRGGSGNMPDFPAWFGPLNLLLFAVQLLVIIPVTRLALGLVGPDETVADMLRNAVGRMPGVLKAFLFLVLLYIGVVIAIVIPLALIGALTGSGRATGAAAAAASPGTSAIAALIAAALLALAFYVMARMSPWMSVLIAENPGARATVRRAWALTRGRAGRILLIFVVLLIAALIASVVVGGLAHALGAAGAVVGEGFGPFLAAVVNGAFGALLSLLYYILLAHLYRHLATGERPAV